MSKNELVRFGNVLLYVGNDFLKWAAFTARFSRSPLPPLELWVKEFCNEQDTKQCCNEQDTKKCCNEQDTKQCCNGQESKQCQGPRSEKEIAFLDRIVSDYGDNSVMEEAPVCFTVESISILTGLLLTDPRQGWSPMERSSRRQKMVPCNGLLTDGWSAYHDQYDDLYATIKEQNPTWSTMQIRDTVCDAVRGSVPVDACTAIAITCNVRSLVAFFHNLRHERFAGLTRDHIVMEEITALRANFIELINTHYAPFKRKIDDAHDTFIDDPARIYRVCSFEDFTPFYTSTNMCVSINFAIPPRQSSFFQAEYNGSAHERENRHGDVPTYYETQYVWGELCAPLSVFREFKRHRALCNYDVHIKNDSPMLLSTPVFWRFTGPLGFFMLSSELRTEEKAHAEIRELYHHILFKLRVRYNGVDRLHDSFFFNEKEKNSQV
jgi:thymidylate synthase ThyX